MPDRSPNDLTATDLTDPAIQLPATIERNRRTVMRGFWAKLCRVASRVPFAHDAVTVYYTALDPTTPMHVRGILFAALAYFILPVDLIPDFVAGFGFTDDAAVIATAVAMVTPYIKDEHRARARTVLLRMAGEPAEGGESA